MPDLAVAERTDNDPLARPTWACVLCPPPRQVGAWHQADSGFATCALCDQQLRERLDDVAARYLRLDARPGASFEAGSRGAPGFGSRPPASIHVICLRDPRSSVDARVWVGRDGRVHRESERPPMSVHGVLSGQAWAVAEHRAVDGPDDHADVYALLRFIDRHISFITRHAELVIDLDGAVRDLLGQLRPVTGDGRRRIGICQIKVDASHVPLAPDSAEAADAPVCGGILYAPLNSEDAVVCRACGTRWGFDKWLELGDLLSQAA